MAPGLMKVSQLPCVASRLQLGMGGKEVDCLAKRIWRHADAVCFDVDSTICQDEAIDELAGFLGVSDQVEIITKRAMNGSLSFREALKLRLDIMKPSMQQLKLFVRQHPPRLTQGIEELVQELRNRNIPVYIVTGGISQLVLPVAQLLGIPLTNVFANDLLFDSSGQYIGFDTTKLTSDSGAKNVGKPGVCGFLKKRYGYRNLVMIGDGATDMEACPPADAFIGFGGNQVRESVFHGCEWMVYDFDTLRNNLP